MLRTKDHQREPDWHVGVPEWFHVRGCKMHIDAKQTSLQEVMIRSTAARLHIIRSETNTKLWTLIWSIGNESDPQVTGTIDLSREALLDAFGLADEFDPPYGAWLLKRYGGDTAMQGGYIRYGNYLNIPCPGTGHDGDPNISIEIDDQMKTAIQTLVNS